MRLAFLVGLMTRTLQRFSAAARAPSTLQSPASTPPSSPRMGTALWAALVTAPLLFAGCGSAVAVDPVPGDPPVLEQLVEAVDRLADQQEQLFKKLDAGEPDRRHRRQDDAQPQPQPYEPHETFAPEPTPVEPAQQYTGAEVHVTDEELSKIQCEPCKRLIKDLQQLARDRKKGWTIGDRRSAASFRIVKHKDPDFAVPRVDFFVNGTLVDAFEGYDRKDVDLQGYHGPLLKILKKHPRAVRK